MPFALDPTRAIFPSCPIVTRIILFSWAARMGGLAVRLSLTRFRFGERGSIFRFRYSWRLCGGVFRSSPRSAQPRSPDRRPPPDKAAALVGGFVLDATPLLHFYARYRLSRLKPLTRRPFKSSSS